MIFSENQIFEKKFSVTDDLYSGFIHLFNDRNPLHTDSEFAQSKGFNDVVMHGNILNGFISYFVGEYLPAKNVIIHSQDIQFKNPVYLNDKLHFRAEITCISEAVSAVEFKFSFRKESTNLIVAKGKIQIGII